MPRQLVSAQAGISSGNQPNHAVVIYGSAEPVTVTGTTAETTLASFVLPADIMGANGVIRVHLKWSCGESNTNNKFQRVRLNGNIANSYTMTTNTLSTQEFLIANRNSKISQIAGPTQTGGYGAQQNNYTILAVDTAQAVTIDITGQLAVATDSVTIEHVFIEVFPAN